MQQRQRTVHGSMNVRRNGRNVRAEEAVANRTKTAYEKGLRDGQRAVAMVWQQRVEKEQEAKVSLAERVKFWQDAAKDYEQRANDAQALAERKDIRMGVLEKKLQELEQKLQQGRDGLSSGGLAGGTTDGNESFHVGQRVACVFASGTRYYGNIVDVNGDGTYAVMFDESCGFTEQRQDEVYEDSIEAVREGGHAQLSREEEMWWGNECRGGSYNTKRRRCRYGSACHRRNCPHDHGVKRMKMMGE